MGSATLNELNNGQLVKAGEDFGIKYRDGIYSLANNLKYVHLGAEIEVETSNPFLLAKHYKKTIAGVYQY